MMLLRVRTLAMGYSGARPAVAEAILALLNAGITPAVPEHGSLGASGDLAPLAHCALVLMGEGEVLDDGGKPVEPAGALRRAGIEPLTLIAK
jgi:histidine ammonia-lyase